MNARRAASPADLLLAEIRRLYQQLREIPRRDKRPLGEASRQSPAYTALEIQIRACADRYRALEPDTVLTATTTHEATHTG